MHLLSGWNDLFVDFGKQPGSNSINLLVLFVAKVRFDELGDGDSLQIRKEVLVIEFVESWLGWMYLA